MPNTPRHEDVYVGGDIAVPTASSDVDELVGRWERELARAARLGAWEPAPEVPTTPNDTR